MNNAPIDQLLTKTYYKSNWFYRSYKQLILASHWIDPLSGEEIKLTHNLKAVYHHRLDQYLAFTELEKPYLESNQTVADKLGIDINTITKHINPLLRRMGLLKIDSKAPKHSIYTLFDLSCMVGYLINKNLCRHLTGANKPSEPITYKELRQIEKNKKQIERIRKNLTSDLVVMTREELDRIIAESKKPG